MRRVSHTYAPYTPVRHVGIGIRFDVVDQGAKSGCTSSAYGVGAIDRLSQTVDDVNEVPAKYATLERNYWTLDGTAEILPDDLTDVQTGWWDAALSDENGAFATPPWVRYDFAGPVSTIGWGLYFDSKGGQYPTSVRVTAYGADGSVVAQKTVTAASPVLQMAYQLADYHAVRFEFLATSEPYRRIRLVEANFGLSELLDANTIGKASFTYGVSLTSDALPSRQLDFTFDNSDKKYNLLDPAGIYEYLQEGQRIRTSLVINGESVDMGSFYFTSASADANVLVPRVQANDVIWELDNEVFRGGGNTEMALSAAVALVLERADVQVRYAAGVADRPVVLAIERKTCRREALRMLAQAARCTVWVDRDEVVHFADLTLDAEPVDEITANELYDFTGVSVSEKTDRVDLVVQNPFLETDEQVVYTAGEGKRVATLENPCVAPSAGAAVAAWILEHLRRRKLYSVKWRGNPAVEIGDTVRIHDIFGNTGCAVVTDIKLDFEKGISGTIGGVGIG